MSGAVPAKPRGLAKMQHVKILAEVPPDDEGAEPGEETFDKWELEDAARTLTRAEEIKADSKLMASLKPHLAVKAKAYKSLSQLRQKADAMTATEKK